MANSKPKTEQGQVICKEMCFFCFDVLHNYLNNLPPPENPQFTNEKFPIFVTWKSGRHKDLRGCIGTFEPQRLHDGLRLYALESATKDGRFQPISPNELPNLHVAVSILTNFEKAENYLDWEVGIHGIRIKFLCNREERSATYLPEVAKERNWDHVQTIDSLLRKGGYREQITPEYRQSIKVVRYQSEKLSQSYKDYQNWRNQAPDAV